MPPEHTTVLALLIIVGTDGTTGAETNVAEAIVLIHAFASFWIISYVLPAVNPEKVELLTKFTPPSILNKLPAPPLAEIVPVGSLHVGCIIVKFNLAGKAFTVTVINERSLSTPFKI